MAFSNVALGGISIIFREDRCMFCRACELACAVSGSRSKTLHTAIGESPPPLKRLRVSRRSSEDVIIQNRCNQCTEAACISVCRFDAITRDPVTRVVQIDEKKCRACMLCVKACGKEVLTIIRRKGLTPIVVKCNYCAELKTGPECVRACPTNALVIGLSSLRVLKKAAGE